MPKVEVRPTLLVAGLKGALFTAGLLEAGILPIRIFSYSQHGDRSDSCAKIRALAHAHGIEFNEDRHPQITQDRIVLIVGWQYLLPPPLRNCIVFHDSLLPELRGFAPTVTALLRGDGALGVTAIRADAEPDTGAVYGSRRFPINPDTDIETAFELTAAAMVELAADLLTTAADEPRLGREQDHQAATQSLWRDEYDYFIDWRKPAAEVLRYVLALGFPYGGAKGVIDGQAITIAKASIGPDIAFAIRDPGKLWRIQDRRALVVCGAGTVWVEEAYDAAGSPFRFMQLRKRFLTADTAWIASYLR